MRREATASAPAKLNLHLGVGPVREDGFHPLVTVYHAVGLRDRVTVRTAAEWEVRLCAADHVAGAAEVPLDTDNLAVRAGRLLAEHHAVGHAARITLDKQIPVAGGMAGGSADAAATLVALDHLWDLGTSDGDLHALAGRLGSDVPFALVGGTALGTGRGEVVEQVEDNGAWWWVVVLSDEGLSTPAVYRRFDERHTEAGTGADPDQWTPWNLLGGLRDADVDVVARKLRNDLQAAALDLRPGLAALLEAGDGLGALAGLVSGSGPSCVFLADGEAGAYALAAELTAWIGAHPEADHTLSHRQVLVVRGPDEGARLETTGA